MRYDLRMMAKVPSSDPSTARLRSRLYVLRKLVDLQTGRESEIFVPLTAMMDSEVSIQDLRRGLRALYRVGLVRVGPGGYRATVKGQHVSGECNSDDPDTR